MANRRGAGRRTKLPTDTMVRTDKKKKQKKSRPSCRIQIRGVLARAKWNSLVNQIRQKDGLSPWEQSHKYDYSLLKAVKLSGITIDVFKSALRQFRTKNTVHTFINVLHSNGLSSTAVTTEDKQRIVNIIINGSKRGRSPTKSVAVSTKTKYPTYPTDSTTTGYDALRYLYSPFAMALRMVGHTDRSLADLLSDDVLRTVCKLTKSNPVSSVHPLSTHSKDNTTLTTRQQKSTNVQPKRKSKRKETVN